MNLSRIRKLWWWLCGVTAAWLLAIPFLWRTDLFVVAAIFGCLSMPFLGGLIGVGIWLMAGPKALNWKQFGLGLAMIGAAMGLISPLESVARRIFFELNYPHHRDLVEVLLANTPVKAPAYSRGGEMRDLLAAEASRGNVYRGRTEYVEGWLQVRLETPSGPTLETILFVPRGCSLPESDALRLVKRDELGSWYFEVR